jgi:hypothetical protein
MTKKKNIDVTVKKEGDNIDIKVDTEKLDVNVVKTEEGTSVTVDSKNPLLKIAGKLLSKVLVKKLNK